MALKHKVETRKALAEVIADAIDKGDPVITPVRVRVKPVLIGNNPEIIKKEDLPWRDPGFVIVDDEGKEIDMPDIDDCYVNVTGENIVKRVINHPDPRYEWESTEITRKVIVEPDEPLRDPLVIDYESPDFGAF